jgi:hypothetical protein
MSISYQISEISTPKGNRFVVRQRIGVANTAQDFNLSEHVSRAEAESVVAKHQQAHGETLKQVRNILSDAATVMNVAVPSDAAIVAFLKSVNLV